MTDAPAGRPTTSAPRDAVHGRTASNAMTHPAGRRDRLFGALTGITALVVLLQFVFAGMFLRYDGKRDDSSGWIDAHAMGAHVATILAFVTAVYAVARLRHRKDLLIGSIALFVLFLAESFIGGEIRDNGRDALTAVHVPIAFLLTSLMIWLPLRSRK